jgi:hypothetical protein
MKFMKEIKQQYPNSLQIGEKGFEILNVSHKK